MGLLRRACPGHRSVRIRLRSANRGHEPPTRDYMIENRRTAVGPKAIAAAVAYAIDAPLDVDANEIVIRPTSQR